MYFYALTEELQATFVVFRDIGQPTIRPWSDDWSSDFGPALGDNLLEFSDTVIRDIGQPTTRPETDDFSLDFGPGTFSDNILAFGTTATQDVLVPREPIFNVASSYISFIEESATIIVTLGALIPIEWVRAVNTTNWTIPAEWRGSPIWDVSSPIEWRAQPVVSWVDGVEWKLSAQNDAAASIDFNMTRQASTVMPIEWRATLFHDDLDLIEPDATAAIGWPSPIEWRSSMIFTAPMPVEWRTASLNDYVVSVEIPGSALGTAISPIDFSQPAQMSIDFAVPLEFVSRIFVFYDEPIATNVSRIRDATIPAEWTGNTGVAFDAAVPLEWRNAFASDTIAPIEWRGTMMQDASSTTEWGSLRSITPVVTVEFSNIILGESFVVPDAAAETRTEDTTASLEINAAPFRDVVVPVTISGSATGTTGDATAPLAFGGGLGSPSYQVSLEFSITLRSDALLPSNWLSTMLSEPETVAETTLSVVGESFVFPNTDFDIITADYATPLEWSTTGISAAMTVQIERVAGVIVDSALPTNWFGTSLSADTLSLIDWTQDTSSVIGDASVPIDWTYRVLVDVLIEIEDRFGRKNIGSSLEPDEWERERD